MGISQDIGQMQMTELISLPFSKIVNLPSYLGRLSSLSPLNSPVLYHPPVEATRLGSFGNNMGKWSQAILSQEGDVYGVPWSAEKVLKIRPLTDQADGMGTLDIDTAVKEAGDLEHIAHIAQCRFSRIMYHHVSSHSRGRSNERSSMERIYGCSCFGSLPVFSPHRPITGVCMLAKVTSRRFGRHKSGIRILMASGWCFCESGRSRKP